MNKLARSVAKVILMTILLSAACFGVALVIINAETTNIIRDRCSDIGLIVAEENCLSEQVGMPAADKLLKKSETEYLRFSTKSDGSSEDPLSYKVYRADDSDKKNLFTYDSATNRNAAITVQLTGYMYVSVPFFDEPAKRTITEEVTVMGLKYYKDKPDEEMED